MARKNRRRNREALADEPAKPTATELAVQNPAGLVVVDEGEHLVEILPASPWLRFRRWSHVARHRFWNWFGEASLWERFVYTLLYLWLPVAAVLQIGWSWKTALALAALIVTRGIKAYRDAAPRNMEALTQGRLARSMLLYRLALDVPRAEKMTRSEISRFREDTLHLIATYVRDHRRDLKGKQVFANLLVTDGDDLVVIARDRPHRVGYARYPRKQMVAGRALTTGLPQLVGDLYQEHPDTVGEKPYRSIMAIPVLFEGKMAGVVSVDSSRSYDFHADFQNLVDQLKPFVGLLAWTLAVERVTHDIRDSLVVAGARQQ